MPTGLFCSPLLPSSFKRSDILIGKHVFIKCIFRQVLSLWNTAVGYRASIRILHSSLKHIDNISAGSMSQTVHYILLDTAIDFQSFNDKTKQKLNSFNNCLCQIIQFNKTDKLVWLRVKTRVACQKANVSRHINYCRLIHVPDDRFSHVHVNVTGLVPTCECYLYLLTYVDRYSRWGELFPLESAAYIADKVWLSGWIMRFEIQTAITTDVGAHFEGDFVLQIGVNRRLQENSHQFIPLRS